MLLHEVREGMHVAVHLTPKVIEEGRVLRVGTKGVDGVRKPIVDAVLVSCPSHPKGVWVPAKHCAPLPTSTRGPQP